MSATKNAPKTIEELKELLKDDLKVKVAGAFVVSIIGVSYSHSATRC